ncbi:DUF4376 domain-containing protein [Moraxella catarrhalis]|uniref:DUF4376 domain-containing protein n=1 Tax=Moraxella catarrhalis TaxID=480 RepID=A0A198UMJ4_MORCA|nr:DUF4376 domain-containing protein [Moraxella catarrhalis]OAU97576.1 hypothetical protein AO384_0612 [Moraxella catarrhalis]OAU98804.1 hypothetical protein AO383_0370 [Moraxella catarrhalis]OAV02894.1 hypothetical protein AO385_0739 [Moraxella catarrhalis]
MFYIFDSLGKNIATCDFEPDREDLTSRGEIAIEYHETVNGELQLIDGEIKVIEVVQSLESKQTQVWEAIKQKRHSNTRGGVYIKSVDKWFHNDDSSRTQYLALQVLPNLPDNLMWKTMDNEFVPMTKDLLDEIAMTMLTEEQADFANAEKHRLAMMQADDPLNYDYSIGWSRTHGQ